LNPHSVAQGLRGFFVTAQTKRSKIIEIAFAPTFDDWDNVIGVPQALSTALLHSPIRHKGQALFSARIAKPAHLAYGIYMAICAPAFISEEDVLAQVGRLRSKFPFMNAIF
jgi:hypothetical protein